MFGGGMRQAGVIAACGLYAIDNHIERLTEDHEKAHRLAIAVNSLSNFDVELDSVQSNMVFARTPEGTADKVVEHLASQGVDILTINDSVVRAVTHLHITDEDIEHAISAFSSMQ